MAAFYFTPWVFTSTRADDSVLQWLHLGLPMPDLGSEISKFKYVIFLMVHE